MNITELINNRDLLRVEWRKVRSSRLLLKSELAANGETLHCIRTDKKYRFLKKQQRSLTNRIKHIEREIARRVDENRK